MNHGNHSLAAAIGIGILLAMLIPLAAEAMDAGTVEIFDRTAGVTLPLYEYGGRRYLAGEPGHEYEIRLRNPDAERRLAVVSVDGVNVITGATATPAQSGYVLNAWQATSIEGWRKSLSRVATFYFTAVPDSYAARTGRAQNVGVIGVAWFREQPRPCCAMAREEPLGDADPATSPPAARAPAATADAAAESRASDSTAKLGTGHGRGQESQAEYTEFLRAATTPDAVTVIYYDSRRRLVAQGVIPAPRRLAGQRPDPFPGSFVADPQTLTGRD
jgi:hypothetical protein